MVTQYIKYYDIKIVLFTIILENYDSTTWFD